MSLEQLIWYTDVSKTMKYMFSGQGAIFLESIRLWHFCFYFLPEALPSIMGS